MTVAKAYLDQLARSQALPVDKIVALQKSVNDAEKSHLNKKSRAKLTTQAASVEASASTATNSADAARLRALAEILKHPAM
jgi:hypothetical protein